LLQRISLVREFDSELGLKRDLLQSQFNEKAFVINSFQKPASFFLIHLKAGPNDPIALILVKQFHTLTLFVYFVYSVVSPNQNPNNLKIRHILGRHGILNPLQIVVKNLIDFSQLLILA